MKHLVPTSAVLLATVALAACGSGNPSGAAAKALRDAFNPLRETSSMNVSCAHDSGSKFTCTVSGEAPLGSQGTPGIYSVTYDPKAKYIYYQKVGG